MEPKPITVTVKLTEKHLQEGIPRDCALCPIALALMDTDLFAVVRVEKTFVKAFTVNDFYYYVADLPGIATDFIASFDSRVPEIKLIEFELTLNHTGTFAGTIF